MPLHTINGIKVRTTNVFPPVPSRQYDWSAVTDDYEAECDSEGWWSKHPVGFGPTEQAAIADLLEEIEARKE